MGRRVGRIAVGAFRSLFNGSVELGQGRSADDGALAAGAASGGPDIGKANRLGIRGSAGRQPQQSANGGKNNQLIHDEEILYSAKPRAEAGGHI